MTSAELWASWRLWIGVAAGIVVVAAGLLILILLTARSILAHAVRALDAAERIRADTAAIWALQASNETAEGLVRTVEEMEATADAMVEALGAHAGAGEGG